MLEENKFSYRALLHGKDAEWYFARGLDDITATGSYEVRLFHNDMESLGITTADCDKEHYVVAHLFVSESAATGKQQALRVVGQTLLLTICATNAVKAFTRTCEMTPKGASWGSWVDLGAASTTDIQDGSITAQKLSSDIRPNAESPLRPLFTTAGAEYNDTGVDKIKTTPWGETVIHKAGHYYLNGLGDITETQMRYIYSRGCFNDNDKAALGYAAMGRPNNIRTNLQRVGMWNGTVQAFICCSNVSIEVVNLHVDRTANDTCVISFSDSDSVFHNAVNLRIIDTRCILDGTWKASSFKNCLSLKEVRIRNLKNSIQFVESPLLSKTTVLYLVEKSLPSTIAITITLHPEAYARLADDADIVAALEAQPLVSLVSA